MFIYEKGRFKFGSVSFALPDGIAVNTSCCDIIIDGFRIFALDDSFEIKLACSGVKIDARKKIERIVGPDTGYSLIGAIEPICYGGLSGFKGVFEDEYTLNEEYAFNTENGGEFDLLDIMVSVEKRSKSYDEAYKNRVVSEILGNLNVE